MMMRLHGPCAVVVALAACLAGGCTSLGERIAQPHSSSLLDAETVAGMESTIGVESATFRTPDGVLLAYASIAPVARDMAYTISRGDSRMKFKFKLGEKRQPVPPRSEEHTSDLQSLMRPSYAAFSLKKTNSN